jgi:hypothetical protein
MIYIANTRQDVTKHPEEFHSRRTHQRNDARSSTSPFM